MEQKRTVTLTTRQVNVLRLVLDRRDFSVEDVARLDYQQLIRTPGIGSKSVGIIREWLSAHGLDLRNSPVSEHDNPRARRLERRLHQAASLLRKHGYSVVEPM